MKLRFLQAALAATILGVAGTTLYLTLAQRRARIELPVYGRLEGFTLRDQEGKAFSREDLAGRIHVVNFIFTSCEHTCPMLTRQMAQLDARTRRLGNVRLLSISVDPRRDTPSRLKSYAKRFDVDFSRWFFLTGPLAEVERVVVNGFMTAMDQGGQASGSHELFEITHGENFVVLDPAAQVRAFRRCGTKAELDALVKVVETLHAEPTRLAE